MKKYKEAYTGIPNLLRREWRGSVMGGAQGRLLKERTAEQSLPAMSGQRPDGEGCPGRINGMDRWPGAPQWGREDTSCVPLDCLIQNGDSNTTY